MQVSFWVRFTGRAVLFPFDEKISAPLPFDPDRAHQHQKMFPHKEKLKNLVAHPTKTFITL